MADRRMGIIAFLFCLCLCLVPCHAQALSTTDAAEPIDPESECTLTVSYLGSGAALEGISVDLYRIAEVSADFQYTFTPPFQDFGLSLNGVQSSWEWEVIRSTLESYILAHAVEPEFTAVTDGAGQVSFSSLKPGLYLTSAVYTELDGMEYFFDPALIALPSMDADGNWQYQISATPKHIALPPINPDEKGTEYKILKLWKGDEGLNDRPQSIEAEIFCNGISFRTVTLSEENHWSYTWTAEDPSADWTVVERNVPAGYSVTVEERETAFVLTNTRADRPPEEYPETGDTSNILIYSGMFIVSGVALVLLSIAVKRNAHEE